MHAKRVLVALIAVGLAWCGGLAGHAAEPLRIGALPVSPPELAHELGSAYAASADVPVAVTVCKGFDEIRDSLQAGRFDVVFGTCPGSAKKLAELGLVVPESDTVIYYYRLAMMIAAGNPRGIFRAEDLARSDVRVGLCTTHAAGPLAEKLKTTAAVVSTDRDLLLDLLEQGRLDVVVGLDSCGGVRPELVTIRLPRRAAGEGAAIPGHAFIAKSTSRQADAQAFLDFCAKSDEARKIMLNRALMLQDGSDAGSYQRGARSRTMPVYQALAQQIAEDYAVQARAILDLGCGPGEMTVEIAKATQAEVTGLDIEPETIELGGQYADECGVGSRMHWVAADVHALPFADSSFDVVVSRGSIFFWRDQVTALREVMRVLRPGGVAFIGGGYGRLFPKSEWEKIHPGVDPNTNAARVFHFPFPLTSIPALMARAGINDYHHITEGGTWIEFRKPRA